MEQVPMWQPPGSNTGVEITEAVRTGVHWMRGTTVGHGVDEVLGYLAAELDASVEVAMFGRHGYSDGYRVGPVAVFHHPEHPAMGVCVDVDGGACDVLGTQRVARVAVALGLRLSRLDLAVDGCPFTPDDLRREWLAGNVRTRAKAPDVERLAARGLSVRPGLEDVPTHEWSEGPTGTQFRMGSRASEAFARCYDRRGPVRFELELKGRTAAAAAVLLQLVDDEAAFSRGVLGFVRRFVDFVDASSDTNASRRSLLGFWAAFVGGVERWRLSVAGAVERTLDEVWAWLERQAAPALALVASAAGRGALGELVDRGRRRWRSHHRGVLARSPDWAYPASNGY